MSQRRYNEQYRRKHSNYTTPEILRYCTEQTRCNVCRTHLQQVGFRYAFPNWIRLFYCPICGKWYGSEHRYIDKQVRP